nr:cytochrome o ubiquinol oxidase subunit I [Rhabdochlamydiaceae bacterium]
MFGRLTLEAFKHDPIVTGANLMALAGTLLVIGLLFYYKKWRWLWEEYLTSLDPKKIGTMYMVVVLIMAFKGIIDAAMMRAQQVLSVGA